MKTVITGSASGIGAAIRARLEKAGDRVIGIDLRDAEIIADLATVEGRQKAVTEVKRRFGDAIDRFVACAGISSDDPSPSRIASTNYFGMIDLLDSLFDSLKRGKDPAAIVISSNSAQLRVLDDEPYVLALLEHDEAKARRIIDELGDTILAYMGSKNAVARAIRRRAMDWGNAGVRLNAVAPGNTNTPQLQRCLNDPVIGELIRAVPRPLNRNAEPDEIAVMVAFLLSRDASYAHGAVYYVDGGIDAVARPDRF
jgi:3alpha-hydroxysteroid 3-dehydrogenase